MVKRSNGLQNRILDIAHENHQGIVKTKSMLREKVWWPNINDQLEQKISNCHSCQVTAPATTKFDPLHQTETPKHAWHAVAIDIQGPYPTGHYIFAMIDYRSRYPIIVKMHQTTTARIIAPLKDTFSLIGYPKIVITDNGTQFTSAVFMTYLEVWYPTKKSHTILATSERRSGTL